jgi:hypothetical protein
MDYISIFDSITTLLNTEASISKTKQSLRKMFLIECRTNQKLLSIASWKDVSDGIKNESFKKLSTVNAKAFYAVSDKTILGKLIDKVSLNNSKETKLEQSSDSSKIISLITRLDALIFLGNLPNELQSHSKAKYTIRINNANKVILQVIEILEEQLKEN